MKKEYLEECKVIRQNCIYTSEAHHQIALSAKRKSFWLEVIPAICAAISSALVTAGILGVWLLPFTILAATISAITAVLSPNKTYQDHLMAAKNFSSLKHDARFLINSQSAHLTDDAFAVAVDNLHRRYNEILKSTPPTDEKSFDKARKKIQSGMHDPDRDDSGEII